MEETERMTEADGKSDATQTNDTDGDIDGEAGDPETAGETTAAEMIGGAPDTRPVGVDTIADIKVSDERE
jgi:hypothetical protein